MDNGGIPFLFKNDGETNENYYIRWASLLGRILTPEEKALFTGYESENAYNQRFFNLESHCRELGVQIKNLTISDGNCLFHSLHTHKIGLSKPYPSEPQCPELTGVKEIDDQLLASFNLEHSEWSSLVSANILQYRKFLSWIIYNNLESKLFNNNPFNLRELFVNFNTVPIAKIAEKNEAGEKYVFRRNGTNAICKMLATNNTWTELPTDRILMLISRIHKVRIISISDRKAPFVDEYNTNDPNDPTVKTIYIGYLQGYHYLGVDVINPDTNIELYKYSAQTELREWAAANNIIME